MKFALTAPMPSTPSISRTRLSRRPPTKTSSTGVLRDFEQFVTRGTSCTSGRLRHTAPTNLSTPEGITAPTSSFHCCRLPLSSEPGKPTSPESVVSPPSSPSSADTIAVPSLYHPHLPQPGQDSALPVGEVISGLDRLRPSTILTMTSFLGIWLSSPTSLLSCPSRQNTPLRRRC